MKTSRHIELMEKEGRKKLKGEQINLEKFMKIIKSELISKPAFFRSVDTGKEWEAYSDYFIKILNNYINSIIDIDEKGKNLL